MSHFAKLFQERLWELAEPQHYVARLLCIDPSLVSRFAKGKKLPTLKQVLTIEEFLSIKNGELQIAWYRDKVEKVLDSAPIVIHNKVVNLLTFPETTTV